MQELRPQDANFSHWRPRFKSKQFIWDF